MGNPFGCPFFEGTPSLKIVSHQQEGKHKALPRTSCMQTQFHLNQVKLVWATLVVARFLELAPTLTNAIHSK